MVTLERALFDSNEALHHMGALPPNKSITTASLMLAMGLTIAALPLIHKGAIWILNWDAGLKYFPFIIMGICLSVLLLGHAYMTILIVLLLIGFLYIIHVYPQYQKIKEFINRYF